MEKIINKEKTQWYIRVYLELPKNTVMLFKRATQRYHSCPSLPTLAISSHNIPPLLKISFGQFEILKTITDIRS